MLVSKFKVSLTVADSPKESIATKESWYPSLKNIYGIEGPNFDGYVSNLIKDSSKSLIVECYTIEGPEEKARLSKLKELTSDWQQYQKEEVTKAIVRHGIMLGYSIIECKSIII